MLSSLSNAWKIPELRKKILFTLLMFVVFRIGCHIPVPGIDKTLLSGFFQSDIFGWIDIISGGSFKNLTIFAMGIIPYINASIIVQLLTMVVPYFQRLQRAGQEGRKKMAQWIRYGAVVLGAAQAIIMSVYLNKAMINPGILSILVCTICLTAGTALLMWIGEQITENGIGNGISLIIMIGIVARLPHALLAEVNARFQTASGSAIMLILELVLLFLVFMATIALVQAVRKVPVQYAKRIVGNKQYGGVRQYIPLKMNAANVMPIIFAQALMFIPALFSGTAFAAAFSSMTGFWYNFTLAVLVIAFTYFYTAIIINPQMMADDMKRNGGFIPGVKPGKQTVNYIDTIMTRITLPGSFFLAIVAILPALAMKFLGIQQSFAYFYGGTSLLIMVGVVLDTLKQIESYLLMRHYDGLMKTGRIQGRH